MVSESRPEYYNLDVAVTRDMMAQGDIAISSQEALTPPVVDAAEPSCRRPLVSAGVNAAKTAMLAIELSPANEVMRFGALGLAAVATKDPAVGALVLGGSTAIVEGGGVFAASKWVAEDRVKTVLDNIHAKLGDKPILKYLSPRRYLSDGKEVSFLAEATIGMHLGSVAVMEAKQREDPTRTEADARRRGLITTAWLSGIFAVEGALIAKGIEEYDNPRTWMVGAALAGLWGGQAGIRRAVKAFKARAEKLHNEPEVVGVGDSLELSDEEIATAAAEYKRHQEAGGGIRLGIVSDEEFEEVIKNPETISLQYKKAGRGKETVTAPFLAPVESMPWYNLTYLRQKYGEDAKIYVFVHPPGNDPNNVIADTMQAVLNEGGVILLDYLKGDSPFHSEDWHPGEQENGAMLMQRGSDTYQFERLGSKHLSEDAVFDGIVEIHGAEQVAEAPDLHVAYLEAVQSGELEVNERNGASMELVMSPEDISRVWDIYRRPFERLTEGSPVLAGFSEEELRNQLLDPEIVKMVHRQDDAITTVCLLSNDFSKYPWFNSEYYKRTYPEYYNTGNIFLLPGIVSDETMRGHSYALPLLDMLTKVVALRGTGLITTWECTEISRRYIPKIVDRAVNASGLATISNLEEPVSLIESAAVTKSKV
jgi:hypothetical protein